MKKRQPSEITKAIEEFLKYKEINPRSLSGDFIEIMITFIVYIVYPNTDCFNQIHYLNKRTLFFNNCPDALNCNIVTTL